MIKDFIFQRDQTVQSYVIDSRRLSNLIRFDSIHHFSISFRQYETSISLDSFSSPLLSFPFLSSPPPSLLSNLTSINHLVIPAPPCSPRFPLPPIIYPHWCPSRRHFPEGPHFHPFRWMGVLCPWDRQVRLLRIRFRFLKKKKM